MLTEKIRRSLAQIDQSDFGTSPNDIVLDLLKESEISFIVCTDYLQQTGMLSQRDAHNISQSVVDVTEEISERLKLLTYEDFLILLEGLLEHLEEVG